MATRANTAVKVSDIDEDLRRKGRCDVRLPGVPAVFTITHRGVEVAYANTRYMMMEERLVDGSVVFTVSIGGNRFECTATQGALDGVARFYVIDRTTKPLDKPQYVLLGWPDHAPTPSKKMLLLCGLAP